MGCGAEIPRGSPVNGKVLSLPEKCRESSGQMLSGPEAVEHLSAFEGSPYGLPVLLGLYTGMRPGEVLGLSWDDVDLVRGTVSVRHSLDVRYGFNLGPPKTPTSVRKIRVPPVVVEALREAGERKPANFWLSQKTKGEDGKLKPVSVPVEFRQVCAFPDGRIMTAKNWGKAFRSTLCAAGLRQIRPHDLRHTHASLLLLGGVPMYVVSRRLGHASVAFTVDLYGHLLPETDSDVASRLEEILEIVNGGDKVGRVGGGLLSIGDLAGGTAAKAGPGAVSPPAQGQHHVCTRLHDSPVGESGMNDRSTLLLEHHLKELKLPSFLREYGKMAAQCAAEGVDHLQYLLRLAELELIDRHQRMVERRIGAA